MTMTMILFLFLIRSRILPKHLSTLVLVILLFVIITTENIRVRGCSTFRYLLLRRWVVVLS